MAKRTKSRRSRSQATSLPSVEEAVVVSVAMSIAQLNNEQRKISQELGRLNAECAKRYNRLNAIELRRAELMREFDKSAKV